MAPALLSSKPLSRFIFLGPMEGSPKRSAARMRVSPLGLHRFIYIRGVRQLVWAYLNTHDREIVRCAQNTKRTPRVFADTKLHWLRRGYVTLLDTIPIPYPSASPIEIFTHKARVPLESLQWLYDRKQLRDGEPRGMMCQHAAAAGDVRALQWLVDRAYVCQSTVVHAAIWHNHWDVIVWYRQQFASGTQWCKKCVCGYWNLEDALHTATIAGNVDILRKLNETDAWAEVGMVNYLLRVAQELPHRRKAVLAWLATIAQ